MSIAIPSRTRPGQTYTVQLFADGTAACPCPAGRFQKACRHVQEARRRQEQQGLRISLLGAMASVRSRADWHPESRAYYEVVLSNMQAELARLDRAGTAAEGRTPATPA